MDFQMAGEWLGATGRISKPSGQRVLEDIIERGRHHFIEVAPWQVAGAFQHGCSATLEPGHIDLEISVASRIRIGSLQKMVFHPQQHGTTDAFVLPFWQEKTIVMVNLSEIWIYCLAA